MVGKSRGISGDRYRRDHSICAHCGRQVSQTNARRTHRSARSGPTRNSHRSSHDGRLAGNIDARADGSSKPYVAQAREHLRAIAGRASISGTRCCMAIALPNEWPEIIRLKRKTRLVCGYQVAVRIPNNSPPHRCVSLFIAVGRVPDRIPDRRNTPVVRNEEAFARARAAVLEAAKEPSTRKHHGHGDLWASHARLICCLCS